MNTDTVKVKKGLDIGKLRRKLTDILVEPQQFLCPQPGKYQHLSQLLLQVYQLALVGDVQKSQSSIMSELVLQGMQEEQIWQQLELRNKIVVLQLEDVIDQMMTIPKEMLEIGLDENGCEQQENGMDYDSIHMKDESDSNSRDNDEQYKVERTLKPKKIQSSVVDDKFFKLCEMEAFLEAEDAKEMRKETTNNSVEDDIDFFGELGDDVENEGLEYKDFFNNDSEEEVSFIQRNESFNEIQTKKKIDFAGEEKFCDMSNAEACDIIVYKSRKGDNNKLEGSVVPQMQCQIQMNSDSKMVGDDDIAKEDNKSSFEMLQKRIQHRIKEYEDEVMGEKPWQLRGEIKAASRPQNSLLEEILEFEATTRPAPIITEETTRRLEDIIRQNIKNKSWDDVKLKIKPMHSSIEYSNELVLDQVKSKQSLAKIYEEEYKNELDKLDLTIQDAKEQNEPKEHQEIRTLMRDLFIKLDALSNFHFTKKPVMPEARIVTNAPAINMEEVAPVAVSDAKMIAPEEIFKREKYGLIGKTERTKADKNRERHKKRKQRSDTKAKETQDLKVQKMGPFRSTPSKKDVNTNVLNKVTKYRNVKQVSTSSEYGSLKSSKAFFSQLQDRAAATKLTFKKSDTQIISARKLKL